MEKKDHKKEGTDSLGGGEWVWGVSPKRLQNDGNKRDSTLRLMELEIGQEEQRVVISTTRGKGRGLEKGEKCKTKGKGCKDHP